jgi:hypothetical protein
MVCEPPGDHYDSENRGNDYSLRLTRLAELSNFPKTGDSIDEFVALLLKFGQILARPRHFKISVMKEALAAARSFPSLQMETPAYCD